jgi:hypothetical protein
VNSFDPNSINRNNCLNCIEATRPLISTSYGDLKAKPEQFETDAQNMQKQWAGIGDLAGSFVLHSAEVEEWQFREVKEGLQEFLDWFANIIESLSTDFRKNLDQEFDFVTASKQSNNNFVNWIEEKFSRAVKSGFDSIEASYNALSYYANDNFDFKDNKIKPMLDKFMNKKIAENLRVRTVLKAMGLKLLEGD